VTTIRLEVSHNILSISISQKRLSKAELIGMNKVDILYSYLIIIVSFEVPYVVLDPSRRSLVMYMKLVRFFLLRVKLF
jgi:hypothetical protein